MSIVDVETKFGSVLGRFGYHFVWNLKQFFKNVHHTCRFWVNLMLQILNKTKCKIILLNHINLWELPLNCDVKGVWVILFLSEFQFFSGCVHITEDSSNCKYPRAETPLDGLGHLHAVIWLPLYSTILWGIVPWRRCLDMYGGYGYKPWQVLYEGVPSWTPDTRRYSWKNCLCCEFSSAILLHLMCVNGSHIHIRRCKLDEANNCQGKGLLRHWSKNITAVKFMMSSNFVYYAEDFSFV